VKDPLESNISAAEDHKICKSRPRKCLKSIMENGIINH
jgi:hypothetical protein